MLTIISFLALDSDWFLYNKIPYHKNIKPMIPTTVAAGIVRVNVPHNPKTGKTEMTRVHSVYKITCRAVARSRFPVGSMLMPAR